MNTSPGWQPWLLAAFSILFFVVGAQMQDAAAGIRPPPLSLEFPWTSAGAAEIVGQWDAPTRQIVRANLYLDLLFIVSYVGFLVVACRMASRALAMTLPWASAFDGLAIFGAILAGLLDLIENAGQFAMLAGHFGPPWPLLTSVCASVKFFVIALALLYVLGGVVAFLIRRVSSR